MTKHTKVYWSVCLVAAIVKSEILALGVPSVSVAVMRDGKMLLERAWGVADVEKTSVPPWLRMPGFGSWQGQFQGHFPALSCCRGNVAPRLSPRTTVRRVNRRDDDAPSLPDATQGVRHPEGHQIVIRRVLPGATPAHHGQIVAQAVH